MDFASDNCSGATPAVEQAVLRANAGSAPAYGDDELTAQVARTFCEVFERDVDVLFVTSGTAANLLCLQAVSRPSGFVLCGDEAHILADEYNGPEFFTGMKLVPVATSAARMTPQTLRGAIAALLPPDQRGPLAALSLTNATESGTTYTAAETAELAALAKEAGAKVHLDGARFANAVAATGDSPADLTWRAGVDLMSFGGTKNGCWAAEADAPLAAAHGDDQPRFDERLDQLEQEEFGDSVRPRDIADAAEARFVDRTIHQRADGIVGLAREPHGEPLDKGRRSPSGL